MKGCSVYNVNLQQSLRSFTLSFYWSREEDQMDQVSTRSGVGSDDITDESTSLVDVRWSTDEEEVN